LNQWPTETLSRVAPIEEIQIAPLGEDGVSYGTPTWMWCVVVEEALYVRAHKGVEAKWYQAAVRGKRGRLTVLDLTAEVVFERVAGEINDRVDEAYGVKYRSKQFVRDMIGPRAREATLRVERR
jgi:hypothetical protein